MRDLNARGVEMLLASANAIAGSTFGHPLQGPAQLSRWPLAWSP